MLLLRLRSVIICHYIYEVVLTWVERATFFTIALRKHELDRRLAICDSSAREHTLIVIVSLVWHVAWNYGPTSISSAL